MKILCIGGGPAGLYFAILMKQKDPSHQITLFERNRPDDTFGFGVVFSERTLSYLQYEDEEVYRAISRHCQAWDPIEVHFKGQTLSCGGNGFSAISRKRLLNILQARALAVGVDVRFATEFDDLSLLNDYDLVVAADGVNSFIRRSFAEQFRPTIEVGQAKYAWFGTTKLFHALTFLFEENEHGIFGVHAYPYDEQMSTFIVETDEGAWHRAGLDRYVEDTLAPGKSDLVSMAYCQELFAQYLDGHALLANNSKWLNFRRVRNETWYHGHIVLMGDAAHTAHFSVGSGTKMAMEDAIALSHALSQHRDLRTALETYERVRRPEVERIQRASLPSQAWWEDFRLYKHFAPEQFVFNFLTRNPRITYKKLEQRDPHFVTRATRWFAREMMPSLTDEQLEKASPLSLPFQLGQLTLPNRIALSLRTDQLAADSVDIRKAGLVMLELSDEWESEPEQLQRLVQAMRARSGGAIGISLKYPREQAAENERVGVATALQRAATIGADLLELDCSGIPIPSVHLLAPLRTVFADEVGRRIKLLAPALAMRISLIREMESVTEEEVVVFAALLKQQGCSLLTIASEEPAGRDQLRQRLLSERVRNEVGLATMLVCATASADEMNTNILAGRTHLYLLQNSSNIALAALLEW